MKHKTTQRMYQEYDYFQALQGNDPLYQQLLRKKFISSIVTLIRDSLVVKSSYATCKIIWHLISSFSSKFLPPKVKPSPQSHSYPKDLLAKQGTQSFIKYSKPFISVVSVLGKVIFKFMTTFISSKSVSKHLLGFAEYPIFLF